MRMENTQPFQVAASDGVSPAAPTATDLQTYEARSTTASFTTSAFFVGAAHRYSAVFSSLSAAADGSVKLQGCNDPGLVHPETPDANLTNWFDVPFLDSTGARVTSQTVSGTGNIVFSELVCTYRWIRLVYTRTSGTASFTARCQFKGVS